MEPVFISGIAMTATGKAPDRSVKDLVREAVSAALSDAGCAVSDIEAAWFSNTRQGLMEGQNGIRGQCALRPLGIGGIPVVNVENACASASTALWQACMSLRAGMYDIVLVVGAEKMFFLSKREEMFRAFLGGTDIHVLDEARARLEAIAPAGERELASSGDHSFFMDMYAAFARLHMQLYGTTERQIAAAAAKNHRNSVHNELSQYRFAMSVDEVLADKPIKFPLTRSMCAPISDGAAAAVVCTKRGLKRIAGERAVRIRSIALASGMDRASDDFEHHIGKLSADRAYEEAGIGPDEVSLAEVHDACSFAELLQIENLGFCKRGESGPMTERGETAIGGRVPVNPSGGLVSKGHPVGATGLIQLYELATQLRGEAGHRQVENARIAVAENGGGFLDVEEAATAVTILSKD